MAAPIRTSDDLRLLEEFVNSHSIHSGRDALAEAPRAIAWMRELGFETCDPDPHELARVREVREALRSLLLANNGGEADPEAVAVLDAAARAAPLRVAFAPDGSAGLEPAGDGAGALIGRVLAAVQRAHADGSWPRLKACAAHDCLWAFVDGSRNRSRTWCDMAACGNRAKARSYRARRR